MEVIVPPVKPFPVATEVTPDDVTYPGPFVNWFKFEYVVLVSVELIVTVLPDFDKFQ